MGINWGHTYRVREEKLSNLLISSAKFSLMSRFVVVHMMPFLMPTCQIHTSLPARCLVTRTQICNDHRL